MKTLLLLRHAKSGWDNPALEDHERPLNHRGLRDAPAVGEWMRAENLVPDQFYCSTALRAKTTAERVAEAMQFSGEVQYDDQLYLITMEDCIKFLNRIPEDNSNSVLVVAHNSGLENLVNRLTDRAESFPTAALAEIELPIESWQELTKDTEAELIRLRRPKEARD